MIPQEKEVIYASQILGAIYSVFGEEGDFHIDQQELAEGDNLTHFIHAMASMAPNVIYNRLTGDNKNQLEFNHLANHLIFQYSTKEEKEK